MLSTQVQSYIPIIVDYLKDQPVTKAWLFGSCARGEESEDSDINLLLEYDYNSDISIMTVSRMRIELMELLHREVVLVENGCLLSFAVPSVERDKILIYDKETMQ